MKSLKENGYTSYALRTKKIFSESTMTKFRNNNTKITVENIENICKILNCQPGDILEYIPDETADNNNTSNL